jgi:hypothetical protein
MALTISRTTLRRLDIQGFDRIDPARLAPVAPWLRLTFGLCAALAITATAFASPALLLILGAIAFVGALSPVHPFDVIYNVGLRPLTGTGPLPKRGAPTRFACGVGGAWLVATALLFRSGYAFAGYTLGGLLGAAATLVSTTDICLPSMLYRMVFGWPPLRTSERSGAREVIAS